MTNWEFRRRVVQPKSLSDPLSDFSPDTLASLLAKSDRELCWFDYKRLLGPYSPAGAYSESVYFLPRAFEYILKNDDEALDLVTSLVWFASEYATELDRDGVLQRARDQISHCLSHWSREFLVHHFDSDACKEKGWNRNCFDHVHHSETLFEATEDLMRFETHADLAIAFYVELSNSDRDATKSAWFLECARSLAAKEPYRPPNVPEVRELLRDYQLIEKHIKIVRHNLPDYDKDFTYWWDTLTTLAKG